MTKAIVGIDPSMSATGICAMGAMGGIHTMTVSPRTARTGSYRELNAHAGAVVVAIIDMFAEVGDSMSNTEIMAFVEVPFMGMRTQSIMRLIQFGGFLRLQLEAAAISYSNVSPQSWKKFAGAPSKEKQATLLKAHGEAPGIANDNEADAYWMCKMGMCAYGLSPLDDQLKYRQDSVAAVEWTSDGWHTPVVQYEKKIRKKRTKVEAA